MSDARIDEIKNHKNALGWFYPENKSAAEKHIEALNGCQKLNVFYLDYVPEVDRLFLCYKGASA